jgi:protein SCO1
MNPRHIRNLLIVATVVVAAAIASSWLLWVSTGSGSGSASASDRVLTTFPNPKPLNEFTLKDDSNHLFDLAALRGKWSFLFFGFTFCPDICPTTMATLAQTSRRIREMDADASDVQFVFVSVDPRRDTPGILQRYVRHFDAGFRGVSGSEAQLTNLSRQLGAAYKVEYIPGVENYPVYHTTAVFLIDPQMRYRGLIRPPFDPQAIASRFGELRKSTVADPDS